MPQQDVPVDPPADEDPADEVPAPGPADPPADLPPSADDDAGPPDDGPPADGPPADEAPGTSGGHEQSSPDLSPETPAAGDDRDAPQGAPRSSSGRTPAHAGR